MTRTKAQGTLWVCPDCMIAREHAEILPEEWRCCGGQYDPWEREPETTVTYDGEIEWSTRECDACGHPCHGERYGYTWWA